MKLYSMPGACSLAVQIALIASGRAFEFVMVDYHTRQTFDGRDFRAINPKGYVPALELADGRVLTEVPVILQYLNDQTPTAELLPSDGLERWRALEWLNFLATEIHKSFSPLFRPNTPGCFRTSGRSHLSHRLNIVETSLNTGLYLLGAAPSAADFYLYTLCRWLPDQAIDIGKWPRLKEHFRNTGALEAVQEALASEKLAVLQQTQHWSRKHAC